MIQSTLLLVCALCAMPLQPAIGQARQRIAVRRSAMEQSAALSSSRGVPHALMLRILQAEDERRWDEALAAFLTDTRAQVRRRAAIAAGRIGDERAVTTLIDLLRRDSEASVRAAAAFALGEIESASSASALMEAVEQSRASDVMTCARSLEALGKIAAALPTANAERKAEIGRAILAALERELRHAPRPETSIVLAGLTATMRARPQNAGTSLRSFLNSSDASVRATTANALTRLRAGDANEQLRLLLTNDQDPIVRANAARALGATEDAASLNSLISRARSDTDARVRTSAIRALASLKNARAAAALLERANLLLVNYRAAPSSNSAAHPLETNELLEIAAALGSVLANSGNERAINLLRELRGVDATSAPEVEIALARIAPGQYLSDEFVAGFMSVNRQTATNLHWRRTANIAQGLGEMAKITGAADGSAGARAQTDALALLRRFLTEAGTPALSAPAALALPDSLRAFAAFKSADSETVLIPFLEADDVFARAAAAELLAELAPSETVRRALVAALPLAMRESVNDATLAILDALAKRQHGEANAAIQTALASTDHLVRRRAVALLRTANAGDFSARIGTVATRYNVADYERALVRRNALVWAMITTDKGAFTIELLPDNAPLTVDNFIELARRNVFNNTTFHRVVPNFVVQGGDYTRGDGNGGPPYQIRCEINEVPYARGAVGMALSGKDTGGSQWFVTHSPQPHLDGGYTVFGRITEGMDVVDRVARGDRILSVRIIEYSRASSPSRANRNDRRRRNTSARERR